MIKGKCNRGKFREKMLHGLTVIKQLNWLGRLTDALKARDEDIFASFDSLGKRAGHLID